MKKLVKLLGILPLLLTGCSADEPLSADNATTEDGMLSSITASISNFNGTTRTLVDPKNNYSMQWTDDDYIFILPQNGQSIGFPLKDQKSSNLATFDGSGWNLRADVPYIAFYNKTFNDALFDHTNVKIEYQNTEWGYYPSQYINNVLDEVQYYDLLISNYTEAKNGTLTLKLDHVGCLVHVTAYDMPDFGYEFLKISTEDESEIFYNRVSMNLVEGTVSPYVFENENDANRDEEWYGKRMSNYIGLNLAQIRPNAGKLDLFLMIYPVDATGHNLKVSLGDMDFTVPGRNFRKGTYQHIEVFNNLSGTTAPGLKHEDWLSIIN